MINHAKNDAYNYFKVPWLLLNSTAYCFFHSVCLVNCFFLPPQVLLYNGQLDIIVGVPLTESMLQVLQWSGRDAYLKADRQVSPSMIILGDF